MCSFWTILMSFWDVVLAQVWAKMESKWNRWVENRLTKMSYEKGIAKKSLVDEPNPSYGLVTSSLRVFYEFFWSSFLSKSHVVGHAKIVLRLERECRLAPNRREHVVFVVRKSLHFRYAIVTPSFPQRSLSVPFASSSFWTILRSFWDVVLGQSWVNME